MGVQWAYMKRGNKPLRPNAQRAMRRISKLIAQAEDRPDAVTEWEGGFLGDVRERLGRFGRAFVDPEKGNTALPLSIKQSFKVRQIQTLIQRRTAEAECK